MLLLAPSFCDLSKWRQFEPEAIFMAVGWYLRFSLSYRQVEELLAGHGLSVAFPRQSLGRGEPSRAAGHRTDKHGAYPPASVELKADRVLED